MDSKSRVVFHSKSRVCFDRGFSLFDLSFRSRVCEVTCPVSLRPLTYSLLHPTSTVEKDFSVIPFSILEHFLMKRLSQRPADGPCDAPCLRSILSHSRLFQECRPFPSFYQPGNRRHVQSFQESLSSFLEFSFRVYLRTVNAC